MLQVAYGAFDGADLSGASFQDATFINADFRNASNIELADFAGAHGLETCAFDDNVSKKLVIQNAKASKK